MNITATIEYLYRDGFTAKLNTSNKKELKQFFEKTCTEITGNQTDREQISECILTIVDNKTNKKICINFDIINYASYGDKFAHILFYDASDKSRKKYIDMIAFGCSPIGVLGFFYFSEI